MTARPWRREEGEPSMAGREERQPRRRRRRPASRDTSGRGSARPPAAPRGHGAAGAATWRPRRAGARPPGGAANGRRRCGRSGRGPPPGRGRPARAVPAGVRRQRPAPRLPRRQLARAAAATGRARGSGRRSSASGAAASSGVGRGMVHRQPADRREALDAGRGRSGRRRRVGLHVGQPVQAGGGGAPSAARSPDHRHRRDELPHGPLRRCRGRSTFSARGTAWSS